MKLLGISAFYHDSAACIVNEGKILAAAQEERFTRKKHDSSFPKNAIKFCLDYSGFSIEELDAVVFYDKPFLKFERLLETYYGFAPNGFWSFVTAMPGWLSDKMFLKNILRKELKNIEKYPKKKLKLLFPEHHLSHASSAFHPSPFEESAILTIDGVGEWATASICHGTKNNIKIHKELRFPHSLGLLYSAFTYYLGFKVNSGEYKLMGLAPYGNPNSDQTAKYIQIIKEKLVNILDDGSIWLNQKYFKYATNLRMVDDIKWSELFGFPRRESESELSQKHMDLAFAIQNVTEEIILKMAKEAKRLTNSKYLCMAGGVALNCVANGKLLKTGLFEDIYIQPASGDAGGALGAALAANYIYYGNDRTLKNDNDTMSGALLGPQYSGLHAESVLKKYKAKYELYEDIDKLTEKIASFINEGKIIGWFQGKMEFGPRALGNRSILADARNSEIQKKLNLKIKYRESFRPFAPSVLIEDSQEFFELESISPYMLLVAGVNESRRNKLPDNYFELPLKDKLYFVRSDVPAITHLDFSARVQTVHKDINERYWNLIHAFKRISGYGIIVNTSFNVRGEPIVCTPEDAYRCFIKTEMDFLVIGNLLLNKNDQPEIFKSEVKEDFVLD